MSALKKFQPVFLILLLSVLTGCSDQITSSGETGSSEKGEGIIESSSLRGLPTGLPIVPTFKTQIKLKAHSSYKFNVLSTGFDKLFSIDINNLLIDPNSDRHNSDCGNISVYNKESGSLLSCHSNGFELDEITVENSGSKFLYLDVSIRGIKQKK